MNVYKQGMVSIWLGNIKNKSLLDEYVDVTYDEDGDSIPSKFYLDFNIDRDETDEDFIEIGILNEKSDDLSKLLEGCSYDDVIIPNVKKKVNITKPYNALILIYNFDYENNIQAAGDFEFVITTRYE